jgi:hypothetical protein
MRHGLGAHWHHPLMGMCFRWATPRHEISSWVLPLHVTLGRWLGQCLLHLGFGELWATRPIPFASYVECLGLGCSSEMSHRAFIGADAIVLAFDLLNHEVSSKAIPGVPHFPLPWVANGGISSQVDGRMADAGSHCYVSETLQE